MPWFILECKGEQQQPDVLLSKEHVHNPVINFSGVHFLEQVKLALLRRIVEDFCNTGSDVIESLSPAHSYCEVPGKDTIEVRGYMIIYSKVTSITTLYHMTCVFWTDEPVSKFIQCCDHGTSSRVRRSSVMWVSFSWRKLTD